MLKWIEEKANGRLVLALFFVTMAVYLVMVLVTIPSIREGSGGVEVFDLRFMGYSEQDARLILSSLPESTRAYYAGVQVPIDFAYPLLMAFFGAFALGWARPRLPLPRWTLALPFLAGAFDYLENIFVLLMLGGHDSAAVIAVANIWTVCKSMTSTVVMTGLLAVFVLLAVKWIIAGRAANAAA